MRLQIGPRTVLRAVVDQRLSAVRRSRDQADRGTRPHHYDCVAVDRDRPRRPVGGGSALRRARGLGRAHALECPPVAWRSRGFVEPEGRRDGGPCVRCRRPRRATRRRRSHGDFDCAACGPGRPDALRRDAAIRSQPGQRGAVSTGPASKSGRRQPDRHDPGTAGSARNRRARCHEFTPELDLAAASYSDRYWDAHRDVRNAPCKITHTRQRCPETRWPLNVQIWEPATRLACSTDPPLTVWAALRP